MVNSSNVKSDNDSKKIFTMLIMVFTLMICTTSATYAYFALSVENNAMGGTAATASLDLSVTQADLKTVTHTDVMVPQLETALGAAMNTTNKCVDGNNNVICKVYTITVTNESTSTVKVNGTIQFSLAGTNVEMPNLKWRRTTDTVTLGSLTEGSYAGVAVGNMDTIASTTDVDNLSTIFDLTSGGECDNSANGVTTGCTSITLTKGDNATTTDSATFYLVVWINEINTAQTDAGTWTGTITFEGENGKGVSSTITG